MAREQVERLVRCKSCGEKIRVQAPRQERELRAFCSACRSFHLYQESEFLPAEA